MKTNNINILIALFSCLFVLLSCGSNILVQENLGVEKYAGAYCSYIPGAFDDTKAPCGYKPFYISHYSRHGSRYAIHENDFNIVSEFEKFSAEGMLTQKGHALLNDILKLRDEHDGMFSFLTQKGGNQQQEIAQRMATRFPLVFKKGGQVRCVSSPAQRCNQSLANFAISLSAEHNELDISIHSGHKYYDIISARISDSDIKKHHIRMRDSLIRISELPANAIKELFNNPESVNVDWAVMARAVYNLCSIMQSQDYDAPKMDEYFTEEQLEILWRAQNAYEYGLFSDTLSFGPYRKNQVAKPILNDFLVQADFALAHGERVADFRFGHDSGLTPLLTLLGLEGYDKQLKPEDAWKSWRNYERVCMASNVQLIFYKHRNKDVIVKILRNEQETYIPALTPVQGPYYSWNDLREYIINILS